MIRSCIEIITIFVQRRPLIITLYTRVKLKALSKLTLSFEVVHRPAAIVSRKGGEGEKLVQKCLETPLGSSLARVTLPRAQRSKLTTMNLRVMPVALAGNKTQRGAPRGAIKRLLRRGYASKFTAIYSPPIVPARLRRCARVCLTLYESHHPRSRGEKKEEGGPRSLSRRTICP